MNKIKNIALIGMVAVTGGLGLTSCDDFLTITPTNSIVEEEFWKDKNDLQNVVNACYARLIKGDILTKYCEWGEMRSDNFEKRTGVSNTDINNVMNANLLPTNIIYDWTPFYNEINFCNKVLAHGPEIVRNDESFSDGDWQPIRAEMLTLRAFSHYYLVRTFERIPYVTVDYNNDSQDFLIGQSEQIEVLDSIIADLEIAKDIAMNSYGNTVEDKGRITKKAVYALLADVYLWRASYKEGLPLREAASGTPESEQTTFEVSAADDYRRCVECCDWVIDALTKDYKKELEGKVLGGVTEIKLEDLFITNSSTSGSFTISSGNTTDAYTNIFGTGNSRESIFELQFDGTNNANSLLTGYFFNLSNSTAGALVCSTALFESYANNPNATSPYIFSKTDYRRWETLFHANNQTEYPLIKGSASRITQSNGVSSPVMSDFSRETYTLTQTLRSRPNAANWIVYRLSDVVLMKAEALGRLYDDEEHLREAFSLISTVYKRSNPYPYERKVASDTLSFGVYNTQSSIEELVLAERQREFVGEGKRWFDLVRYAQRCSNNDKMLNLLTRKYQEGKRAIQSKLKPLKALFAPIYTKEMKNNKLLEQNPIWDTGETTSRTDQL